MEKRKRKLLQEKEKQEVPPEEAPLVVPKVIRQYIRKREPVAKKLAATNSKGASSALFSGLNSSELEGSDHVKIINLDCPGSKDCPRNEIDNQAKLKMLIDCPKTEVEKAKIKELVDFPENDIDYQIKMKELTSYPETEVDNHTKIMKLGACSRPKVDNKVRIKNIVNDSKLIVNNQFKIKNLANFPKTIVDNQGITRKLVVCSKTEFENQIKINNLVVCSKTQVDNLAKIKKMLVCSKSKLNDQAETKNLVDNSKNEVNNQIRMKEDGVPEIKILDVKINSNQNSSRCVEVDKMKEMPINSNQNCSNHQAHTVKFNEDNNLNSNISKSLIHLKKSMGVDQDTMSRDININLIEGMQQKVKLEISVKAEPLENADSPPYADEINVSQPPHQVPFQNKTLVTEELDIKEEIDSDTDTDNALPSVTDVKEEPVCSDTENAEDLSEPHSTFEVSVDGKVEGLATLKKCFLVTVDVEHADAENAKSSNSLPFEVVSESEIFTCDMCQQAFVTKSCMRRHMRTMHRVPLNFGCPSCPARFAYHYLRLAHLRCHSDRPLNCDLCSRRFKTTKHYSGHLNTHLRERLFSCPVCLNRYTSLENLQRHATAHMTAFAFNCDACGDKFRSAIDLRRHRDRVHGESCPCPCYVCGRVLRNEPELYAHLGEHENALYECAFCPGRFTDPGVWEEHSAAHIEKIGTDEVFATAPHACLVCRKRFVHASTLRTHTRSHTQERPYACRTCPSRFKTRSALTEHERAHGRPYACAECGARFGRRDTLERHERLHSGERPYSCTACLDAFAQRTALLSHVKRHHTPGLKRIVRKKKTVKISTPVTSVAC